MNLELSETSIVVPYFVNNLANLREARCELATLLGMMKDKRGCPRVTNTHHHRGESSRAVLSVPRAESNVLEVKRDAKFRNRDDVFDFRN